MNFPTHWYTASWVVIVAAAILVELVALADPDKGDTFSEHVWAIMFHNGQPRPLVYYLVGGFMVWLTVHFLFRGRLG